MENKKTITSEKNEIIKSIIKLKKGRNRKKTAEFLIDGKREIEIAIESNIKVKYVFLCLDLIKKDFKYTKELEKYNPIYTNISVFKKISYKENPDGFLIIAEKQEKKLKNTKINKNENIVVLESIEKPGNLGAIIRTSYAAGVKNIILTNNKIDIYNPNIIRASEGMIFKINLIEESNEKTLLYLKDKNFKIYCAATSGSKIYTKSSYKGLSALVFGSEANGLSEFWLKNSDQNIKIPMLKGIDSLNISVSVAVILFEVLRQKS